MMFKPSGVATSRLVRMSGKSAVEYLHDLQRLVEDLSHVQTKLLSHLLQGNLYDDVDQQGDLLKVRIGKSKIIIKITGNIVYHGTIIISSVCHHDCQVKFTFFHRGASTCFFSSY